MTVKTVAYRVRNSDIWLVLAPLLVGAAYAWWRYRLFSFWKSLFLIIVLCAAKWWLNEVEKKQKKAYIRSDVAWFADLFLPYILIVAQLLLNTGFALTAKLAFVWFGIAWPFILLSVGLRLTTELRLGRKQEEEAPSQLAITHFKKVRLIFVLLPIGAYAEMLLLTFYGYLPLLTWSMIVLFPLVFAQALAVGLESDLDKEADLPVRNLMITALAMVLVLVVSAI